MIKLVLKRDKPLADERRMLHDGRGRGCSYVAAATNVQITQMLRKRCGTGPSLVLSEEQPTIPGFQTSRH